MIKARHVSLILCPSRLIVCESFLNTAHSFGCCPFTSLRQYSLSGKHSFVPNGCGWLLNQWHVSAGHVTLEETYPVHHFLCTLFSLFPSQSPHFVKRVLFTSNPHDQTDGCDRIVIGQFFASHIVENESFIKYLKWGVSITCLYQGKSCLHCWHYQ